MINNVVVPRYEFCRIYTAFLYLGYGMCGGFSTVRMGTSFLLMLVFFSIIGTIVLDLLKKSFIYQTWEDPGISHFFIHSLHC